MRIFCWEDEQALRTALELRLRAEATLLILPGWPGRAAEGNQSTLRLIILDVMLPYRNGFDVCRDVRQQGWRLPF